MASWMYAHLSSLSLIKVEGLDIARYTSVILVAAGRGKGTAIALDLGHFDVPRSAKGCASCGEGQS